MRRPVTARDGSPTVRHGLARVLSKLGVCSRSQAARLIAEGRVSVNGRIVRDPEWPTDARADALAIDGTAPAAAERVYLALNKPRGLVTSAADERGRATVYAPFAAAGLPWVAPVGRLDRASEGLLLLTNDTAWAAAITDPRTHLDKRYHVQIDRLPDAALLEALRTGADVDGERLALKAVEVLRSGERNAWLEVVLDEGRNRHIRRVLAAFDVAVLRLVRVAIGPVVLGALAKGAWRHLEPAEIAALQPPARANAPAGALRSGGHLR
ncbi:MAG TPA: pseudouridine synthase [Dokdonella sp.]|uniref:pseudouridine synthase n=1 Tax=Dokdonella sp. TaxID=2291710 RepID=UPI002B7BDB2C|nr:pseudouridine synthase [Dokdonella sp.]HUD42621.1 pseudouridine synthase [Dokdonella sp.]